MQSFSNRHAAISDVRARLVARVALVALVAVSSGCGGTVVFEEDGGAGAGRGDGGSSRDTTVSTARVSAGATTSGGDGGADVTSTAIATSNVSVATSTATGIPAACAGAVCGDDCVMCNDFECVNGFCDELLTCVPERVCPPPTETLCYRRGLDEPCADIESAPFVLCRDCSSGKGCTFFGEIFAGPFVTPDECCYEVDGACAPNP